jgi:hypothetical protein
MSSAVTKLVPPTPAVALDDFCERAGWPEWCIDPKTGRYIAANRHVYAIYGDVVGRTPADLLRNEPLKIAGVLGMYERAARGEVVSDTRLTAGTPYFVTLCRADGLIRGRAVPLVPSLQDR